MDEKHPFYKSRDVLCEFDSLHFHDSLLFEPNDEVESTMENLNMMQRLIIIEAVLTYMRLHIKLFGI